MSHLRIVSSLSRNRLQNSFKNLESVLYFREVARSGVCVWLQLDRCGKSGFQINNVDLIQQFKLVFSPWTKLEFAGTSCNESFWEWNSGRFCQLVYQILVRIYKLSVPFSQLFSTSVCCSSIHLNTPIKPADLNQKTLQHYVKPAQEFIFKVLNWWELRSHKTRPTARNKAEESSEERLTSFDLFAVSCSSFKFEQEWKASVRSQPD